MASSLVTTPGSSSADSYISLADADTFFGKEPTGSNWSYENGGTARSDDSKDDLLRKATRDIDIYLGEFGISKLLATGYYEQALMYPCEGYAWCADHGTGHARVVSADSGSTTTFVSASLQHSRTNQYAGGSVYVSQTTDYAAPIYETQPVSAYNASTYTITVSSAFTAAIGAGDTITLVMPVPPWLKNATCLQALHIASKAPSVADQYHRGIASEGGRDGDSKSFVMPGIGAHLDIRAKRIIDAQMPRFAVLTRG